MIVREQAGFDVAVRLRQGTATLGEVYAFISGLYFRGKLAYVRAFGEGLIIAPGLGLVSPEMTVGLEHLERIAAIDVDEQNAAFTEPFIRDAGTLAADQVVLLGSIATPKYTGPLLEIFGDRLVFPAEFVGRGDMSRGGLMLRCALSGNELTYVPVRGAKRRGTRPPKLERL